MPSALIVGNDSEIGSLVANYLRNSNWAVFSTSRRREPIKGTPDSSLYFCDLLDKKSISDAATSFIKDCPDWNLIVLSVGVLNPIGRITETQFDVWEESIQLNFLNQFFLIREVIRKTHFVSQTRRTILTFAGSGTNSAPVNFSAYTLSKIALIKAMELLAAEYENCAFVSLGTGWIKSAIHNQTLEAGESAGSAFQETVRRFSEEDFGDPYLICEFISWMNEQPIRSISGLNFALQGDDWKSPSFSERISELPNNFKLRRMG
jgi:NAD(P)-dependent dehydrogenase (short-subunit alcohol dehydrogenase family)